MVYNASNVVQKSTDYAGEFIYEGTTGSTALQFINHEEGRIIPSGNEYQYPSWRECCALESALFTRASVALSNSSNIIVQQTPSLLITPF